jgi:hypothetical protein
LLLMHDCYCFLFRCPCVLSLSLSLFKIFFSSLPSILNLKRISISGWLKENVYLWLESWKANWRERDKRGELLKFLFDFILGWFIEVFIWFFYLIFLGWPGHLTRDLIIKPDRLPNRVSKLD